LRLSDLFSGSSVESFFLLLVHLTEVQVNTKPASSQDTIEGEAPIGRILNAGNTLKVHVAPSLVKNLLIENLSNIDTSIVVTPIRSREIIENQVIEKTISPKSKIKPSFSNSLNIDLIEVKANEGAVKINVLQESFFADEI